MPGETHATPAVDSGDAPSLERIGATLTSVSDGLTTAFMQLEELQAALRTGCEELARRQQALAEREAELQRRAAEQDGTHQAAQRALEARQIELDRLRETLQVQQSQYEEQQKAAAQANLERERAIDARQQEHEQARESLAAEKATLESERAKFESERTHCQAQLDQLEQQRRELEARERQIEQRFQELAQAQTALEKRHQAVARFQRAFSEMAASLGIASPNLPELDTPAHVDGAPGAPSAGTAELDLGGLLPADAATPAAPEPAAPEPVDAGRAPRPSKRSAENRVRDQAGPTDAGDKHAPMFDGGSRTAQEAAAQAADQASAAESSSDSIDEAALPPDVLSRLRVLRRLTGGKVADTQLLDRIRQERGVAEQQGAKQKRRWWG